MLNSSEHGYGHAQIYYKEVIKVYLSVEEAKQYPILYRATFTFIHGNKATLDVVNENAHYYYYIEEVENFPWEPAGTKLLLGKLPKDEIINVE